MSEKRAKTVLSGEASSLGSEAPGIFTGAGWAYRSRPERAGRSTDDERTRGRRRVPFRAYTGKALGTTPEHATTNSFGICRRAISRFLRE